MTTKLNYKHLKNKLIKLLNDYLKDKKNKETRFIARRVYLTYSGFNSFLDNSMSQAINLLEEIGWNIPQITNLPRTSDEEIRVLIKKLEKIKPRKFGEKNPITKD